MVHILDIQVSAGTMSQGNAFSIHHDIYSRNLGGDVRMQAFKGPSLRDLFFSSGATCLALCLVCWGFFLLIWQA